MPTRVCDICFKKLDSGTGTGTGTVTNSSPAPSSSNSDLPPEYLNSTLAREAQTTAPAVSGNTQIQEDDDLQIAIAMSLNEAENKDKPPPKRASSPSVSISSTTPSAPPPPASTLYASIVHNPIPAVSGLYSVCRIASNLCTSDVTVNSQLLVLVVMQHVCPYSTPTHYPPQSQAPPTNYYNGGPAEPEDNSDPNVS